MPPEQKKILLEFGYKNFDVDIHQIRPLSPSSNWSIFSAWFWLSSPFSFSCFYQSWDFQSPFPSSLELSSAWLQVWEAWSSHFEPQLEWPTAVNMALDPPSRQPTSAAQPLVLESPLSPFWVLFKISRNHSRHINIQKWDGNQPLKRISQLLPQALLSSCRLWSGIIPCRFSHPHEWLNFWSNHIGRLITSWKNIRSTSFYSHQKCSHSCLTCRTSHWRNSGSWLRPAWILLIVDLCGIFTG